MKRLIFSLITLGVLISFIFSGSYVSGNSLAKVDKDVISKSESVDKIRVLVKIKDESDKKGILGLSNGRGITENQKKVVDSIDKNKVKHEFEGMIYAELSKEEIEKLASENGVESIELEGIRYVNLQDSIPQINATQAHTLQVNGLNLTGMGQTVCVVDTGVNYTHESLGGCFGGNDNTSSCKIIGGYDFVNSDSDPMDDQGHGTHVSGIVAGNGTITGVAPGARIVSMKVCDAAGSCNDGDVAAGINWCSGNKTNFNISVISMSLGSGLSSSYCNSDALAGTINNAIANNISVVVATGNGLNNDGVGRPTQIAAPACVQNVTRVSSVTKSDVIASYANRNELVSLMTPGSSINSTCITSDSSTGYCTKSGTSMATPHVSGSIAVLREFLTLTGQNYTPAQVESLFNVSGKIIVDTDESAVANYSRIQIYETIIVADNVFPNITLITPSNGSSSLNGNITFSCNATDLSLRNMTFYLWNSTESVVNQTTLSFTGSSHEFNLNISNVSTGDLHWNCEYTDEGNNIGRANDNFTITSTSLVVTLSSPQNKLYTNQNVSYECNVSASNNVSNATFYIWNSTGFLVNSSNLTSTNLVNSSIFYYNFSYEDNYTWNCEYVDNNSISKVASSNYSLTYDITFPQYNITSPLNGSWVNTGQFNVSLNENGTCLYTLDGGIANYSMTGNESLNFGTGFNASNSSLVQDLLYNVSYICNDTSGNINISQALFFQFDLVKPNITLISPIDDYSATSLSLDLNFTYNVSDNLNISSCSLVINNAISLTNATINNQTVNHTFAKTLSYGSYTWNVNCTDQAVNIGNSSSRSLTINAPSSSSSSSSSSGGGTSTTTTTTAPTTATNNTTGASTSSSVNGNTYSVSNSETSSGYKKSLKKLDKVKFIVSENESEEHTITIEEVQNNSVNLSIRSDPIYVLLGIGEGVKLNLTSLEYYDLFIRLDSIFNSEANLTIQTINEITGFAAGENESDLNLGSKGGSLFWIYFAFIVVILVVFVWIFKDLIGYRIFGKDK